MFKLKQQNINWLKVLQTLVLLSLGFVVLIIFCQQSDLSVLDLGRHLQNGALVFKNPSLLWHNFYSYTYPSWPFVNHHWLAGFIYYLLSLLGGFKLLTAFNVLLALASVFVIFIISRRRSNFFLAALATLLTVVILSERADIRPEMFSYLFLALTFYFLENYRANFSWRCLIWLPILFLVWVNTHIYFVIGLALVTFKFLELMINKFNFKEHRRFIYLGLASLGACLFNPNTIKGLLYPLQIFKNYGYEIAENKSILFLQNLTIDYNIAWFKALFVVFIFSWLIYFALLNSERDKKLGFFHRRALANFRVSDLAISFLVCVLAWRAIRYLPLFSLLITPILAKNLALIKINSTKYVRYFKQIYIVGLVSLIVFAIFLGTYLVNDTKINHYFLREESGLGLSANVLDSANYFKKNNLSGPILNNYDIGSYLIYALPAQPVFVDNRPEAYPKEFFSDIYVPLQDNEESWNKYNAIYKFQTIYFSYHDGTPWARKFLRSRLNDSNWSLVYFDYYAVILVPAGERAGLTESEVASRINILQSEAGPKQKLSLANFASIYGDGLSARGIYQELLLKFPVQAELLANLYFNYSNSNLLSERLMAMTYWQRAIDAGYPLLSIYNSAALLNWNMENYYQAESIWRKIPNDENAKNYLQQFDTIKKAGLWPR